MFVTFTDPADGGCGKCGDGVLAVWSSASLPRVLPLPPDGYPRLYLVPLHTLQVPHREMVAGGSVIIAS